MCDLFAAVANIADSNDAAVDLGIDWGTRQFTLRNDSSVPCCAMSRIAPAITVTVQNFCFHEPQNDGSKEPFREGESPTDSPFGNRGRSNEERWWDSVVSVRLQFSMSPLTQREMDAGSRLPAGLL